MAAGFIASSYPSIGEHEANVDEIRRQISALRQTNAAVRSDISRTRKANDMQTEKFFWAQKSTVDLEDRAKYIQIASISNPGAIAQYCPNLKGPAPYHFYQEQVAKIRAKTRKQLMEEADRLSGNSPAPTPKSMKRQKQIREVPSNFSPGSGTQSSLRKQEDPILLGLRNLTHWNTNRKPGRLPELLPRGSEEHPFKEHTSSWMARTGEASPGRNRDYVSSMTRTASALF
eukprot:TRINITY_DN93964_c0_g1_i1.p1 TRINITY_DN93964_c0_g1~~TRINITY_DN93964_c0_g1_i1.p1  ORF type:complete len:230 (+),score=30.87 TRINITY_DN93964_c0_g1_i1:32-721(+)